MKEREGEQGKGKGENTERGGRIGKEQEREEGGENVRRIDAAGEGEEVRTSPNSLSTSHFPIPFPHPPYPPSKNILSCRESVV